MRVKRIKRWCKACLLAGPLRERQGAKAPYSVRATKWFVPTAKHRHSQWHHWGRRGVLSLSEKKMSSRAGLLLFFFLYHFLLSFLSATFFIFFVLHTLVWITTMAACSTPMENSVFKRPLSQTLSSCVAIRTSVCGYITVILALNLPVKYRVLFFGGIFGSGYQYNLTN